ncbi:exodeoxyribonuclease VII large subunit [Boudabousia tangfeifanii]|nr:exodeoxyribonuclease VII large subunit [Boudabousia tangfeifanii]
MSQPLAATALETTRENPWPLRLLSEKMKGYIDRMSPTWIEAEVEELSIRPGNKMTFLTLRDLEGEEHLKVSMWAGVIAPVKDTIAPGSRVVVYAKPTFWTRTGTLQLQAAEIHLQGLGEMLARIEQLRVALAQEGIFDASHKKPLPVIPRKIGLICGQGAKAEQDVIVNARGRWPAAQFETRYANVQGEQCPPTVVAALQELDQIPDVDVIIITRGGGAVADLLPFSDERIVRAAFAAKTPIVSAIGHETDCPLLDLVADYRASTPTDAAKRVVPDLETELTGVQNALAHARTAFTSRLRAEMDQLAQIRSRPTFASPAGIIDAHQQDLDRAKESMAERLRNRLEVERVTLGGLTRELAALSPGAIMERGYSVVRGPDKKVITSHTQAKKGDMLQIMLAEGNLITTVQISAAGLK